MRIFILFIALLLNLFCLTEVQSKVLTADTIWRGTVDLREDVLVMPGVTLTIAPATIIKVWSTDNTKIDPEYLSHLTEILVRGKISGLGEKSQGIVFEMAATASAERWAGIIIDGGEVALDHCLIKDSNAAVTVIAGELSLQHSKITGNRYGLIGQSEAAVLTLIESTITNNDYGFLELDNPLVTRRNLIVSGNDKDDYLKKETPAVVVKPIVYKVAADVPIRHTYKNETLVGVTIWKGRILIDGQLRLSPDARLFIMPGTIIEFTMRDSNGDGIGENGLMIQGHLVAKGTPEKPIIFRAAGAGSSLGAWDAINILGSDLAQNILEYCQIENAYRGVHFHFSNVVVNHCIFRNNYRGAQFQESLITVSNCQFYDNKSAMQARDSQVVFNDNELFFNINGANLFRFNLKAHNNSFGPNRWDGLRIREGTTEIINNRMLANRTGLVVADAVYGVFNKNVIAKNLEFGMVMRNSDNIEVHGNAIVGNGVTGIALRDTRADIGENLIAANGERGIGIDSFTGVIENNNILDNGLYGIGLDGADDITATSNFWGESDLAKEIYDRNDEAGLGLVRFAPQRLEPLSYTWPLVEIKTEMTWSGEIYVPQNITVPKGANLRILPATKVVFGDDVGLEIFGDIQAEGKKNKRIIFTSRQKKGPSDWGQLLVEYSTNSVFSYCDFIFADWGLHFHFVPAKVSFCRFINNDGGMRFRSGPIEITNCLFTKNRIGLRSFRGIVDINHCDFHDNETAIFIREGGSGVKINFNNLFDNERYNLRLGDFNKEDVNAVSNWWGSMEPQATIFDRHRESYIGTANFEPILKAPLVLEEIM